MVDLEFLVAVETKSHCKAVRPDSKIDCFAVDDTREVLNPDTIFNTQMQSPCDSIEFATEGLSTKVALGVSIGAVSGR